ncbi:hypothetical protein QO002_002909 [Pararhizobium capsulatum DSM 1112]|uniref:Protein yippee-like n=1 Tax=Pararhizobium capsulatum DSM 1112 TaxID=1121113 RepID=A0ABU0BRA9_9HYPH|nr:hypothetical protein [Pararhizobium capsulatum]MDQ0320771.1 hypothetical protein [Pararhizobium capsulatum DSM 1112]
MSKPTGETKQFVCQGCNNEVGAYLIRTEIFEREEDAKTGTYVDIMMEDGCVFHTTDTSSVIVDNKSPLGNNPSKRRNGLRIHFGCEYCDETSILSIASHKGNILYKFGTDTVETLQFS